MNFLHSAGKINYRVERRSFNIEEAIPFCVLRSNTWEPDASHLTLSDEVDSSRFPFQHSGVAKLFHFGQKVLGDVMKDRFFADFRAQHAHPSSLNHNTHRKYNFCG